MVCVISLAAISGGCLVQPVSDGSGTLEILHAGTHLGKETWYPRFTYKCARGGLRQGGSIHLILPPDLVDTEKLRGALDANFLKISTNVDGAELAPSDTVTENGWHLQVKMAKGRLDSDSRLEINFDNNIPPLNSGRFYVGLEVDANGDGNAKPIEKIPPIFVTPNMIIKCPRLLTIKEPFDVKVKIQTGENRDPYEGSLLFSCSDDRATLPPPYSFRAHENGTHTFEGSLVLSTPGYHVLTAFDIENPALQGEVVVACRNEEMEYSLFFGETHEHTGFTDGRGHPDDYFKTARDQKHLDFTMLTDHDYLLDEGEWEYLIDLANSYNEPGDFVTLHAYEWSSKFGDKNIYFQGSEADLLKRNEPGSDHPEDLFDSFRDEKVLMIPHHCPSAFRPTDWRFHDPELVRIAEIYSLHGRTESYCCMNPITPNTPANQKYTTEESVINVRGKSVQDALGMGQRLGIIASSDSHSGLPSTLGMAAVYATDLSRQGIFEALYSRRCYGTTHSRIVLDFKVEGNMMGEEIIASEPIDMEVTVIGTAPIEKVEVLKNNKVFFTHETDEAQAHLKFTDYTPVASSSFYYARITQQDGEMAWSSPVWVDSPSPDLAIDSTDVSIDQHAGFRMTLSGKVINRGMGDTGQFDLTLFDSFEDGLERSVASTVVQALPGKSESSFNLEWNSYGEPGIHEFRLAVDPENRIDEADENNNDAWKRFVVTTRMIESLDMKKQVDGGSDNREKIFFNTEHEWVRIDIEAAAEFKGVRGKSPAIIDDDLTIILDGVNYGFSEYYSWDGGLLRGKNKKITINKIMKKGRHILEFEADRKPFLGSVEISGTGIDPALQEGNSAELFAGFQGDEFRWLDFTIEDGVSIWRQPIDEDYLVLNIIWSKDYGSTSNFTETFRWYRGELRFENCLYNIHPWYFSESSDHLADDGHGSVSWVFRANKPGGLMCIIGVREEGVSPSVSLDVLNGGKRFPDRVYYHDSSLEFLPVKIALAGKRLNFRDPGVSSLSQSSAINSINMAYDRFASARRFGETLGILYKGLSTPEARIENMLLATRRKPDNAQLHFSLAKLYKQQKMFDDAVDIFKKARDLGKDDAYLYLNLGQTYAKLGRNTEAEESYQSALKRDPLLVQGYLDLGRLYFDSGNLNMALPSFEKAVAIQSFNAQGQYYLGELYFRKGLTDKAGKTWEECVRLDPVGKHGKKAADALARIPHIEPEVLQ